MKSVITAILLFAMSISTIYAQGDSQGSTRNNFRELRKKDFSKLSGIDQNFEGISFKYDKDKAILNFGQGIGFGHGKNALNINLGVGTTTDLTKLFKQDLLPVFTAGLTYNRLLGAKYYYDGQYDDNFAGLNGTAPLSNYQTSDPGRFRYKQGIRENIRKGKYDASTRVYSHKRLYWIGIGGKYNNNKYAFYDASRVFAGQQYDTVFQTFSGTISLNGYAGWNHTDFKWTPRNKVWLFHRPEFVFGTIYATVSKNNNINELKKVPISDIKESYFDSSSQTTRQILSKDESYYQGKYIEFYTTTVGTKIYYSPITMLTLNVFADVTMVGKKDISTFGLNDGATVGAGIFIYVSQANKSSINIGVDYKRVQNITNTKWNNRLELVTSVPISGIF